MKALFIVGVVVVVAILCVLGGIYIGLAANVRARIRELGFTRESAKIYRDAMKTLNRMVSITELHGDFAPDILSDQTRQHINSLIQRYEKEVNQQ